MFKCAFIISICLLMCNSTSYAQMSFNDTLKQYDKERILTNLGGVEKLGYWAAANVGVGIAGWALAKNDDWKYFHQMNAAYGAVNLGIAYFGFRQARRQAASKFNASKAYTDYISNKSLLKTAVVFDLGVAVGGAILLQQRSADKNIDNLYKGYGTALILQGLGSFVIDNLWLYAHQKNSSKWGRIMYEMNLTGSGLGFSCTIPHHLRSIIIK